jgi:CheY-like chemotaxis protein
VPLVLALEPDPRQAEALKTLVEQRVHALLLLTDSKDGAIAALAERVPDLILVTALLSPRDEAELTEHLRTLEGAEHLQTLMVPLLSGVAVPAAPKRKRGFFSALQRQAPDKPTAGCDPVMFAEQILSYLERAQELKAEAAAARPTPREEQGAAARSATTDRPDDLPDDRSATPREASSSYWDWDSPSTMGLPSDPPPIEHVEPADALDEHPPAVIDAVDALLGRPGRHDDPSPLAAIVDEATAATHLPDPFEAAGETLGQSHHLAPAAGVPALEDEETPADEARGTRSQDGRRTRGQGRRARASRGVDTEVHARVREEAERERAAREAAEREAADRDAEARALAGQLAWEQAERERVAAEAEERARIAREDAERELAERERAVREEAERERQAREQAERELADREE